MIVLWFSNNPANGSTGKIKGTGSWLAPLDRALQDDVDLRVAFHHPYKKAPYQVDRTTYYPIYTGSIIVSRLKEKFFHKAYDEEYLDQYLAIIKEVNPDIIHIHGTEFPYAAICGKVNKPIVISIQGNINVYYLKFKSGLGDKYLKTSLFTLNMQKLLFEQNFRDNYLIREHKAPIELRQLSNAHYIIGRTDWDRRITSVMAPQSKYYVGQEMMRPSFFKKSWCAKNQTSRFTLFTINGESYFKGFETVCHALHILQNYGLEIEWQVAGVNEDSLINKITRKYLGKKYPSSGLKLLGSLDEDTLSQAMLDADIYLMVSHIENSPNNLCEAMCLGMPCIATHAGGTASLLEDGKEGIIIQDGDPWVMAGAVLELLKDKEKAMLYGQNARTRALARHDKNRIASDLIQTYKDIIADYDNNK